MVSEILKRVGKSSQVRVVNRRGGTLMLTYPTIESARRAARAWTVAYNNCWVAESLRRDLVEPGLRRFRPGSYTRVLFRQLDWLAALHPKAGGSSAMQ